jgi:hypothetical protein
MVGRDVWRWKSLINLCTDGNKIKEEKRDMNDS